MNWHRLCTLGLTVLTGLLQPVLLSAESAVEVGTLLQVPTFGVSADAEGRPDTWSETMLQSVTLLDKTDEPDAGLAGSRFVRPDEVGQLTVDSLTAPVDTVALRLATDSLAGRTGKVKLPKPRFVPDPNRALWLSLVLPGAGQIYNRKYWKLPFIYGGFMGCAYALIWNQQMYRDYSQAYLDIMDDNPATHSYTEMLPPNFDMTGQEEHFKKVFKRKKDFYRRNRDLSAFCFVGVYILSVVDAYVDAQLSVFDISPDLSMSVEPAVITSRPGLGTRNSASYGVGCSLRF